MNFLELCKASRRECGIQGEGQPTSVDDQYGLLHRIVEWVKDADMLIQSMHPDWNFLWKTFEEDVTAGSDKISKPDDFGMWDRSAFAIWRGTVKGRPLNLITYKQWRSNYNVKLQNEPNAIAITPNNDLVTEYPSSVTAPIYGEYWKIPIPLTTNDQIPVYPERYHRAIIARTKMWFFEDIESLDQWKQAKEEFDSYIDELESNELPEQQEANQSSPDDMVVRPA